MRISWHIFFFCDDDDISQRLRTSRTLPRRERGERVPEGYALEEDDDNINTKSLQSQKSCLCFSVFFCFVTFRRVLFILLLHLFLKFPFIFILSRPLIGVSYAKQMILMFKILQ